MIRTAILAGIFLIMLAMSFNRPGGLRQAEPTAASVVKEHSQKAVAAVETLTEETLPSPKPAPQSAPAPQAPAMPAAAPPAVVAEAPAVRPLESPIAALPTPPLVDETADDIIEDDDLPPLEESDVMAPASPTRLPARAANVSRMRNQPAPLPAQSAPRRFAPTDGVPAPVGKPTRLVPLIPAQTAATTPVAQEAALEPSAGSIPEATALEAQTSELPAPESATRASVPVNITPAPAPQPLASADLPTVNVPTRPVALPWDAPSQSRRDGVAVAPTSAPAPATAPETARAPSDEAAPKFMTPQERSRELYRLAREMESTFIDKMAR